MQRHNQPRGFGQRNFPKPRHPPQWSNCPRPPAFFPRRRVMSNRFQGPMMRRPPPPLFEYPPPIFHHHPNNFNGGHPSFPDDCSKFSEPNPNEPDVWIETVAPDGKVYYYHAATRATTWDRPEGGRVLVKDVQQQEVPFGAPPPNYFGGPIFLFPRMPFPPASVPPPFVEQAIPDYQQAIPDVHPEYTHCDTEDETPLNDGEQEDMTTAEDESSEERRDCSSMDEEGSDGSDDDDVDRSRPVSSTPLPGSKWCVVWTGDHKVFFHDPEQRVSVWEMPDELSQRADVRKLVEAPPEVGKTKEAERVEAFRQMLAESGICATSDWTQASRRLSLDARWTLLSPEARKTVFEAYAKSEAERGFKTLLRDVAPDARFDDFARQHRDDPRFKAVADPEGLFRECVVVRGGFLQLLRECPGIDGDSEWAEVARGIRGDPRYLAVASEGTRERLFGEFIAETFRENPTPQRQRFVALLERAFRNPFCTWAEALRVLMAQRDRPESVGDVKLHEMEHLFDQNKSRLISLFRRLLDGMPLDSRWKDVRKFLSTAPRLEFRPQDEAKWEREFAEYMKERVKLATESFRDLLRETPGREFLGRNLQSLENVLSNDKRYSDLERFGKMRREMLLSHIDELHRGFAS